MAEVIILCTQRLQPNQIDAGTVFVTEITAGNYVLTDCSVTELELDPNVGMSTNLQLPVLFDHELHKTQ